MRDAYADALVKSDRHRQPIRMALLMLATMLAVLPAASAQEEAPLAPDFEVLDLDGQTVRFSDYAGRVVIVNFWATWCFPCRFEMPLLHQLYRRFEARGLVVLARTIHECGSSGAHGTDFACFVCSTGRRVGDQTVVAGLD